MHRLNAQHSKTQNLLLISKLLDCRENISPFTLILDSVNQSSRQLVHEFLIRAQIASVKTIFLAFESLRCPSGVSHFVQAHALDSASIQKEVSSIIASEPNARHIIVLDTLHPLSSYPIHLPSYLTGLLSQGPAPTSESRTPTAPSTSLLAVYHADQPVSSANTSPYGPKPLTLLAHLATAVLTVHSPQHVLARSAAQARSLPAPVFGMEESVEGYGNEAEGILQGLGSNDRHRIVVDGEVRRRSGRAVGICFVLDWTLNPKSKSSAKAVPNRSYSSSSQERLKGEVYLLNDHPLFQPDTASKDPEEEAELALGSVSFNLNLTQKQRRDREGVVLPYFDAQNETGLAGEGGRILYDMGEEDDFDEEEDEI